MKVGIVKTIKFLRKPFYVDAVQVTEENILEVAKWCDGEVRWTKSKNVEVTRRREVEIQETTEPDVDDRRQYVRVRVVHPLNDRQTMAFVGDWVLYSGSGYKVYTKKAMLENFDPAPNGHIQLEMST